jgi:broad specificity phosphatase PhoE
MSEPVAGRALDAWSTRYDAAPLRPESLPPDRLLEALASVTLVAASDLRRARESALRAAPRLVPVIDPLYREAPLPIMRLLPVVMQARRWSVIARIAWYFGASGGRESLRDVRGRADAAAAALTGFSAGHEAIALFAHGMFNRFLAHALLRRGWRGPRSPASAYWGFSTYTMSRVAATAGVPSPKRRTYG